MCLAVPMRIVAIEAGLARCEAKGVERTVNLILMQHECLSPGDLVMVHVGYAIQTMTEEEARESWDLIDEMLAEEERLAHHGAPGRERDGGHA
jgi:hydrogenase expression/formation protein HypC